MIIFGVCGMYRHCHRMRWRVCVCFQQEGSLCAQHCLNNLLQGEYFSPVELSSIAHQLDEEERMRMAEGGVQTEEYRTFLQVRWPAHASVHCSSVTDIPIIPLCSAIFSNRRETWMTAASFPFKWVTSEAQYCSSCALNLK